MTDSTADPTEELAAARAQYENDLAALRAENAGVAARLGVMADRLAEAEEILRAIRSGEIDALVVSTTGGDRLFTLAGADHPYRVMVESMQEGAATVSHDGFIRYANRRLGQLLDIPLHRLIGASASTFVAVDERANFERLLHDAARTGVYAEMKLQQAHGAAVAAYIAASPLQLADTPAVCLVITDLTKLNQAQETLVAVNRTLERHSRRSEILSAASAAFAEAGVDDLDEVLDVVASELVALVGDHCIVWLLSDGTDSLDAAVIKGTDPAAAAAGEALRRPTRIGDHSPLAEVFRSGRPALAADVEGLFDTLATEYVEFLRRFRVQTMMFVPLRVRGESRGVVTLSRFPPSAPYTADDLTIAVDIADRAAMSIENARMFRDKERAEARLRQVNTDLSRSNANLEQSNRNLQQFAHIAATVADARSLKSTLNTIAKVVVDATGAGACAIVLVDGQPPQAHLAGLAGLPDDYPQAYAAAVRRGRRLPALQAYETGRPVLLTDTRASAALAGLTDQSWPRLACFPLIAHGSPVGAITMLHAGGPHLDDAHVRFLQTVADQVAVAVNAARLSAQAAEALVAQERQRLARELHDSVSQSLFSMTLLARASSLRLRRPGREGSAELQEMLTDLENLSTSALAEMRALLYQLRPQTLSGRSLLVALQAQADALQDRLGLTVAIEAATWRPLPAAVEEELFRIALEALANLVRHASATKAQITLTNAGGVSVLSLVDDGIGFDVTAARPGHLGLETMAERAERIGAHLDIDSTPGQGTRVRVLIPRRAAKTPETT